MSRAGGQGGLYLEGFESSGGQGHRAERRLDSGTRDRVDGWVTSGALRERWQGGGVEKEEEEADWVTDRGKGRKDRSKQPQVD